MNALTAAKRLTLLTMALILILTTTTALAKDDEHGYLGVMLQGISSSMAKALQLDDDGIPKHAQLAAIPEYRGFPEQFATK